MKFAPATATCRFWGYEPAIAENLHNAANSLEQRRAAREQIKADKEKIKAAGHKASQYGFKTKGLAVIAAKKVETATGVELRIFNHDYL